MEKQQKIHKTALIYCRIGSNQVQDGAGFTLQEAACVQYALSLGYVVGRVTKEVSSGTPVRDRPLFSRDLSDLQRRLFDALIAYSPDRLSRDPRQMASLALECEQAGVALLLALERSGKPEEYLRCQINEALMRREEEFIRRRLLK